MVYKRVMLEERFYERGTWEQGGVCFRCGHRGWSAVCHLLNWHSKSKYHRLLLCYECLNRLEGRKSLNHLKDERLIKLVEETVGGLK